MFDAEQVAEQVMLALKSRLGESDHDRIIVVVQPLAFEGESQKPAQKITLGDFFQIYLERHAKLRCVDNGKEIEAVFNRYLQAWQEKDLAEISIDDISQLHTMLATTISSATANTALKLLKQLYYRAIRWQYFRGTNPALAIEMFSSKPRDRFLAQAELKTFFSALDASENDTFRDFVRLCLMTGARKTNVLRMRYEQIDWDLKVWRIPRQKNGAPHVVPLVDEAMLLLTRRLETSTGPWVLPGPNPEKPYAQPYGAWNRLLARAGIKNLTIHDLRRSHASYMVMTGASLPVTGKALGHRSPASTAIYTQFETAPVRKAMQAATTQILSIGEHDQTDDNDLRGPLEQEILSFLKEHGVCTSKQIHTELHSKPAFQSVIAVMSRLTESKIAKVVKVVRCRRFYELAPTSAESVSED